MSLETKFFSSPASSKQKQYEALRAFYYENQSASEVAAKFGYTLSSFYSLTKDFKKALINKTAGSKYFTGTVLGRKPKHNCNYIVRQILELRKKYLPIDEIKSILDSRNIETSESYIYKVLRREGFERLPRRDKSSRKQTVSSVKVQAPKAELLEHREESFNTTSGGIMAFLPYIRKYGIDNIINKSDYPETKTLPKLNSILSFIALKVSGFSRYTKDDLWCMDRGLGLFAGLNVLPKAAWFTSYSHRITRDMNLNFLKELNRLWKSKNMLSDTANLDFTSIPYWGENGHLENNWSGKRRQALPSILAALSHDPESGIITYGDTNIRQSSESDTVLEFLDFYREDKTKELKYLVFDSKFTNYQNLKRLNDDGIKFITIRRRGKNIVENLNNIPKTQWKNTRVETGNGKKRNIKTFDSKVKIKGYGGEIRQVAVTGNGKIKPALIITNEYDLPVEQIVRKYAKRWIVEKTISEQIYFFHLNKVSSSMVIKVDFDLTMTILANNLYRLIAADLEGYRHNSAETIFNKFISNAAIVSIKNDRVNIELKKKRNLPALLTAMKQTEEIDYPILENKKMIFSGATHS
jgi:transposase